MYFTRAEIYKASLIFILFLSLASALNISIPWWNNSFRCRAELQTTEANSIVSVQNQSLDMDYLISFCGVNGTYGDNSVRLVYQNQTDSISIPANYSGNSTNLDVFYLSDVSSQQMINETKTKDLFHPNNGSGSCYSGAPINAYDRNVGDTSTKCGLTQGYTVYWNTALRSAKKNLDNITVQLVWSGYNSFGFINLFMKNTSGDYVQVFYSNWVPDQSVRANNITICNEGCDVTADPNTFNIDDHFEFLGNSSQSNYNQGIFDIAVGYTYASFNTTGDNDSYYLYFSNESKESPENIFAVPVQEKGSFTPTNCGGTECWLAIDGNYQTAEYPDDWFTSATGSITGLVRKLMVDAYVYSCGEEVKADIYDIYGNRHFMGSFYYGCSTGEYNGWIHGSVCESSECSVVGKPEDFILDGGYVETFFYTDSGGQSGPKSAVYEITYNYLYLLWERASNITNVERLLTPPTRPENLTNSSQADTWVYLAWNASESTNGGWIDGYVIWINGTNLANATDLFYNATGLAASSDYNFTVAAVDNYGLLSENASIIVRTSETPLPPTPPQNNPSYSGGGGGGSVSFTPPKKTDGNTSLPTSENVTNTSAAPEAAPPSGTQGGEAAPSPAITGSATDIQNAQAGVTALLGLVLALGTYGILRKAFTGFPEKEKTVELNPDVVVTEVNGQKVFLDKDWLLNEENKHKWKKILSKPIESIDIPKFVESQFKDLSSVEKRAVTKLLLENPQSLGLDIQMPKEITYRHPDETIGAGELPITLKPVQIPKVSPEKQLQGLIVLGMIALTFLGGGLIAAAAAGSSVTFGGLTLGPTALTGLGYAAYNAPFIASVFTSNDPVKTLIDEGPLQLALNAIPYVGSKLYNVLKTSFAIKSTEELLVSKGLSSEMKLSEVATKNVDEVIRANTKVGERIITKSDIDYFLKRSELKDLTVNDLVNTLENPEFIAQRSTDGVQRFFYKIGENEHLVISWKGDSPTSFITTKASEYTEGVWDVIYHQ